MACKYAHRNLIRNAEKTAETYQPTKNEEELVFKDRLLFGVDSKVPANDVLQNNLTEFEWVARNKMYPNFWGRNICGDNCLTKQEIEFIHNNTCKIAAICSFSEVKESEKQGMLDANKAISSAVKLEIPNGTAIFLKLADSEKATANYMKGFAESLLFEGYIPAFMANTDAAYEFDHEFSIGMQQDKAIFGQCLIWAVAPSLKEYDNMTTTHLIHPDNWKPFAPSAITRNDIAVWQYGKNCHPINDDAGNATSFNVSLVRNAKVILDRMF